MKAVVGTLSIAFRNVSGHEHRIEGVTRGALSIAASALADAPASRAAGDGMPVIVEGVDLERMSDRAAASAIADRIVAALGSGGAPWRS